VDFGLTVQTPVPSFLAWGRYSSLRGGGASVRDYKGGGSSDEWFGSGGIFGGGFAWES
jgi:hypothetical protein